VNQAQVVAELAVAVTVAVFVLRYWRQIMAFVVAVLIGLGVIGLLAVISWFDAWPHR
jgi:hypothetical protein